MSGQSREELLLENILGASNEVIPQSRVEILLKEIAESGGGGGDSSAVKYTEQSLTDAQKAQARTNIGAGTANNPTVTAVSGATPTIAAADNTIYSCGELTSLTITDSAQDISFTVDFASGATATTLTVPSGYKAPGGDLTPEANKTYELNVRNGKAVLTAFEAVSSGA